MAEQRSSLFTLHLPEPFGKTTIHVLDTGAENAPHTALCVHGLTRNAHDFDHLAHALAEQGWRVFALDMPGRGDSPWLEEPMLYGYPLYVAACIAFIDNFHLRGVEWIGTSMGGLIGLMIAATQPNRISKLVMNDIGARLSAEGIERITNYVSTLPSHFPTREEAERYLRTAFAPFGIREEAVWQEFIRHSIRESDGGGVTLRTDPAIAVPLVAAAQANAGVAVDLSAMWEQVRCPALILRGEQSDLLSAETVSAMLASNLKAESATIAGCGHAPSLTTPEQIAIISRFLHKGQTIPAQAFGI